MGKSLGERNLLAYQFFFARGVVNLPTPCHDLGSRLVDSNWSCHKQNPNQVKVKDHHPRWEFYDLLIMSGALLEN